MLELEKRREKLVFENMARVNLLDIREETGRRLQEGKLQAGDFLTGATSMMTGNSFSYAQFLEKAALLDFAIKKEAWETAEDMASFLMRLDPYKTDQRCAIIVHELLAEADLERKGDHGTNNG